MGSQIDFSSYTLDDLHSSAASIDREKHPQRAKEIDDLIREKASEQAQEIENPKAIGEKALKVDRLMSAIIDGVISMITMAPMFYYVGFDAFADPSLSLMAAAFLYGLLTTLLLHGYFLYNYGQTIGKNYKNIRIENLDGTKASLTTIYFKRMLPMQLIGLIPSVGQLITGLVNPLFIFGQKRRCLHDYIAQTKVSYTKPV